MTWQSGMVVMIPLPMQSLCIPTFETMLPGADNLMILDEANFAFQVRTNSTMH